MAVWKNRVAYDTWGWEEQSPGKGVELHKALVGSLVEMRGQSKLV